MLETVLKSLLAPVLTLVLFAGAAAPHVAAAAVRDPEQAPSTATLASELAADDRDVTITRGLADQYERQHSAVFVLDLDLRIKAAAAERSFRQSVRKEQAAIYLLAGDPVTERAVESKLDSGLAGDVRDSAGALRAIWRLAGVDDIRDISPHYVRDYRKSLSIPQLRGLYQRAAGSYGMDWTYLAAINFVESDFGRVLGPSTTGALGPMQFEPATWEDYGAGSIMNPHDSINAAARYLHASGAPGSMGDALYSYNPTWDYVEAVSRYAAAIHRDQSWMERLYYWSTAEP